MLNPVFGVNPNPDLTHGRSTSIMGAYALPDEVDGLLGLAGECCLTLPQARERMSRIAEAALGWSSRCGHTGFRFVRSP